MIPADGRLCIDVTIDDSKPAANVALCLGLILTDWVINSIKHAFPDHRRGLIINDFRSHAEDWVLTVAADGVGMHPNLPDTRAGLGSSIVQALALQTDAVVEITNSRPGTVDGSAQGGRGRKVARGLTGCANEVVRWHHDTRLRFFAHK